MDIVETRSGDVVTLALKGRVDGSSSSAFETRVLTHIDAGDRLLILDLAQLDYINSLGLRVFTLAAKRLKPLGGRIVLCALQPSIKQLFDIAGFSTIFAIAATREEAAALLAA
jgi:stage II sporulation protein AA (anti-sigma F factor antagonist)